MAMLLICLGRWYQTMVLPKWKAAALGDVANLRNAVICQYTTFSHNYHFASLLPLGHEYGDGFSL